MGGREEKRRREGGEEGEGKMEKEEEIGHSWQVSQNYSFNNNLIYTLIQDALGRKEVSWYDCCSQPSVHVVPSCPTHPLAYLLLQELEALMVENFNKFTLKVLITVPGTSCDGLIWSEVIEHVDLGGEREGGRGREGGEEGGRGRGGGSGSGRGEVAKGGGGGGGREGGEGGGRGMCVCGGGVGWGI